MKGANSLLKKIQKKQERERQRREENRLRNERLQREIAERQRIQREDREAAEQGRKLCRLLELQAKSASERQALFEYQFGTKINLVCFHEMDINDVIKIRIGVIGPAGSGKSCFINTCERVVRNEDKGTCPISSAGEEGTIVLEDFLPEMFFRLVDTRGFISYDVNEGLELEDIRCGRLKHGDVIKRRDQEPGWIFNRNNKAPFRDRLYGFIIVVKANDPRLKEGVYKNYLRPVSETLHPKGIFPLTVVTHKDTLHTQEECDAALELASAATGSPPRHTFLVANYCPDNPSPDVETELQIFGILHCALFEAERYVQMAKLKKSYREENQVQRAFENARNDIPSRIDDNVPIEIFLAELQKRFSWDCSKLDNTLTQLKAQDINTMGALAANWEILNEYFECGMRNAVQAQLQRTPVGN